MPRIPVRVEPYSSPSKQHRHYKSKRDQVLRSLGKAAYINGSQFALLLVSARGDVETYASDALQSRLDSWFVKSGIADEARYLARKSDDEGCTKSPSFAPADDSLTDNLDDISASASNTSGVKGGDDPFFDSWQAPVSMDAPKLEQHSADEWQNVLKHEIVSDDNQSMLDAMFDTCSPQTMRPPQMSTPVHPSPMHRASISQKYSQTTTAQPSHLIELKNEKARTDFIELRFSQLQQVMCKMIAKEWVKVIEPKKQTRFPYNKGEAGKPAWWPVDVRHKEPDHLMKPERHALLLAILRSSQTRIARLQLATAEVVALIKAGKVSYLMDIYRVAREEEKLRDDGLDVNTPVTVQVSSLEGWDCVHGCVSASSTNPNVDVSECSKLKDSKGKRRTFSQWEDDERQDLRTTPTWMPSTPASGASNAMPVFSSIAPRPPYIQTSNLDVPSGSNAANGGALPGAMHEVPIFSPRASTDSYAQPASVSAGTLSVPFVQSPVNTPQSLPVVPYGPDHLDVQRSASVTYNPTASAPMRPTHSSPAHFSCPDTLTAMRHASAPTGMPSMPMGQRIQQGTDARQQYQQLPSSHVQQQPLPQQRATWSVHQPVTPYQRPPQTMGAWASMPETPMHKSQSMMPVHMGLNVSPSHDLCFSSSFDSSFSSSHPGPVTPAQFPLVSMSASDSSHLAGKSPTGHAMPLTEFGLPPSTDIQSLHAKQLQQQQQPPSGTALSAMPTQVNWSAR